MPLNGLHVVCAFAGGQGYHSESRDLISQAQWSQTMPTAATTSKSASVPAPGSVGGAFPIANSGQPVFRIYSSVDSWVSVGTAPDASGSTAPRMLVPAALTYDLFVQPGDYLAWAPA